MSFYNRMLKRIGLKRVFAQQLQPTVVKPIVNPATATPTTIMPAQVLPAPTQNLTTVAPKYNGSQGQRAKEDAERANLRADMENWLFKKLPESQSFTDLELMLSNDGLDYWMSELNEELFYESIENARNSIPGNAASPQELSNHFPDLSRQDIEQIVLNQGEQGLPLEITENQRNQALYDQIVGEQEGFGEDHWKEDEQNVGGISAEDLTQTFMENYLLETDDDQDFLGEESTSVKRWKEIQMKFPDSDIDSILKSRVFRGVEGGYSSSGGNKEDFRIKFFIENASWLSGMGMLPESVSSLMNSGSFGNNKETYINLSQDIDSVTGALYGILGDDNEEVKAKVWDWVLSKIGSDVMGTGYESQQYAANSEGTQVDHGVDIRKEQLQNNEPELSQDQRSTIMDAYKGDLQSMGQTLKFLGKDVREHIINELSEKNPNFAPGGKWFSKTIASEFWPDQAAKIIDSLVNSDAFSDPKKLKDLERKGKATFKVENGRVIMRPSEGNTWDSIDFSKMLPLDEKLNIWIDNMVSTDQNAQPDSYLHDLQQVSQLGTTKIDRERMSNDPEYKQEILMKLKKGKTLHDQMNQMLTQIGEYLVSDEVVKKYPKNVLFSYLDLITTHKNIKEVGALLSENSETGKRTRQELVFRKIKEHETLSDMGSTGNDARIKLLVNKSKKQDIGVPVESLSSLSSDQIMELSSGFIDEIGASLPQGFSSQQIMKIEDSQLRQISDNIINQEIKRRSNVSGVAQDYYKQLLDLDGVHRASFDRQLSIIRTAIGRIFNLTKLSSVMSKFSSINGLDGMKESIRNDMINELRVF